VLKLRKEGQVDTDRSETQEFKSEKALRRKEESARPSFALFEQQLVLTVIVFWC
jgi:hypothetical protein